MRKMYLSLLVIFCLSVYSNFCFAATFSTYPPKGSIHNAQVVYKDADEVTVKAGYGECNGKYWEITASTDLNVATVISGVTEDFVYIYIDDSASYYPTPTLVGSLDEPAWSDTKQGWYRQSTGNTDDRMIGVAYVSPAPNAGVLFDVPWVGGNKYSGNSYMKSILTGGTPNNTWKNTTVPLSDYIPVSSIGAQLSVWNSDVDGPVYISIRAIGAVNNRLTASSYGTHAYILDWMYFSRDLSRNIQWIGSNGDDSDFDIIVMGYEIER